MARAATTTDAFNAVAEPRRREILDALAPGERSVNDLVAVLGLHQPDLPQHLQVLRDLRLGAVREDGRRRLYRVQGRPLKPIHDWIQGYERMWTERFDRLDEVLAEMQSKQKEEEADGGSNQ